MTTRTRITLLLQCAIVALLFAVSCATARAADNSSLLPKYGSTTAKYVPRPVDRAFLQQVDTLYKKNRKKAATELAAEGWQLLRRGESDNAMRRFNQAWLCDARNGTALWGMAEVATMSGRDAQSLQLFAESEKVVGKKHVDFAVDRARAIGTAGAKSGDKTLLADAFERYRRLYAIAPQSTLNLENWAITLYAIGDYPNAWNKIALAEATPDARGLDPKFIDALQAKMPRPPNTGRR